MLTIRVDRYETLLRELARRGGGVQESGAFLLTPLDAATQCGSRPITGITYYDDLDPACLTGGITFGAIGYSALNEHCRRHGLQVAADIHTHPGTLVRQSHLDRSNPMIALPGHVAIIAPRFAQGVIEPTDLGVHVFAGAGNWTSSYGHAVTEVVSLEPIGGGSFSPLRFIRRLFSRGHRR
ncbi:hypothetical protein OHB01_12630 [Microbispora hainanensis]|uniref:hypothetical protein n=1 Tax=Microbispora hainanensis TaxID=568844 RepID=UPI002E29C55E|nr:hypothetical protein [Microbispora hainanensis]